MFCVLKIKITPMRKLLFVLFSFCSVAIMAQQTITHHEIENDVKPSGKLELFYGNTGFPISEFFVGKDYTLLFSRYTQAFYLLENETGLIADQLFMKNVEGLKSGKMNYSMQGIRKKHKIYFDLYLTGYQGVISRNITRMNDTLFYCGLVRRGGWSYANFYVGWAANGKLQYDILDNVPEEKDFVKPKEQFEITFNKNSLLTSMAGHYYYPENSYIVLTKSPWEKVNRKPQCELREVFLYTKNAKGKFFPAVKLNEKQGTLYNLFMNDENIIFYNRTLQKNFLVLSGDTVLRRIPHPGKNYANWLVKDMANGDIYLFADVHYKKKRNPSKLFEEFARDGECDKNEKVYDIYKLDRETHQFKNTHHLKITGQIALYLNEKTDIYLNDATFRMYNRHVYLNIPVYSPDEQLGIFNVQLDWKKDTTHINTYYKKEFVFMKDAEKGHKGISESVVLANDMDYQPMPGKYANAVTGKRFHKNKTDSITDLLRQLQQSIETTPEYIPAKFVAYDQQAVVSMKFFEKKEELEKAFIPLISKWKMPLHDLLKAITLAGENVDVEQKGKVRHYTTPDGWHCSFVEIKGNWYLYYQFHKFDAQDASEVIPELPEIE